MKKKYSPLDIDVLILCGGKGSRLRDVVKDKPKPMADIKGRPFLDILIDHMAAYGFQRFILCAGYKGEIVRGYYRNKHSTFDILISQEIKPLGTAGAIKNAQSLIRNDPFLVMNGDSFCSFDLRMFINFYKNKKASFLMALVKAKGAQDYGVVNIDASKRIISFNEKVKAKRDSFINAGIYLLEKNIFSLIAPEKKLSLEYDIFPKIVNERFYGYITEGELIDIGTPDRYAKAKIDLNYVF